MDQRVLRRPLERPVVPAGRLVQPAQLVQRRTELVQIIWIPGLERHRHAVLRRGVRGAAASEQDGAEVGLGGVVARIDGDRLPAVRLGLIEAAGGQERHRQVVVGLVIELGHGHRAGEQRDAVAPVPHLSRRDQRQRHHRHHRRGGPRPARPRRSPLEEPPPAPGQQDEQPHVRHIGVPVGHRLRAHLHQPDHRQQRHQVPAPSRRQPRQPARPPHRRHRRRQQRHAGGHRHPGAEHARQRVEHRQVRRPEQFTDVADIGLRAVGQSLGKRQRSQRHHRRTLRQQGDDARRQRQRRERRLLQQPPAQRPPRRWRRRPARPRRQPRQRPSIQQQQHHRHAHQHRLGHQPQREQGQTEPVQPRLSRPGPARVCRQRQEVEQGAQHVLALRHPRHRLHVRRVQGEQRRDEPAQAGAPGQPPQQGEQQQRVEQVQRQAAQVVAARPQPEQLHVQHVGPPGEGVPVAGMAGGERPAHRLRRQPLLDVRVFGDVQVVVVVDELVAGDRRVHRDRRGRQQRRQRPLTRQPGARSPHRGTSGSAPGPTGPGGTRAPPPGSRTRSGRCAGS